MVSIRFEVRGGFRRGHIGCTGTEVASVSIRFEVRGGFRLPNKIFSHHGGVSIRFEVRGGFRPPTKRRAPLRVSIRFKVRGGFRPPSSTTGTMEVLVSIRFKVRGGFRPVATRRAAIKLNPFQSALRFAVVSDRQSTIYVSMPTCFNPL